MSFIASRDNQQRLDAIAELTSSGQRYTDVIDIDRGRFFWRVGSAIREEITSLSDHVHSCSHLWTHSVWDKSAVQLVNLVDKVVYVVRDPRDIAISMSHFAFTPYFKSHYPHGETSQSAYLNKVADTTALAWRDHVAGWTTQVPNEKLIVVFYERMRSNPEQEIASLCSKLGYHLDDEALKRVFSRLLLAR